MMMSPLLYAVQCVSDERLVEERAELHYQLSFVKGRERRRKWVKDAERRLEIVQRELFIRSTMGRRTHLRYTAEEYDDVYWGRRPEYVHETR